MNNTTQLSRNVLARNRRLTATGVVAILAALACADWVRGQVLVPFQIDSGRVISEKECAVKLTVLGAANRSSAHGGYDRATTLKLHVTDSVGATVVYEPFGSFEAPVEGNVNDGQSHTFTIFEMHDANSEFVITGRSWSWDGMGNSNSDWSVRQTENSNLDPDWVVVLRDGDVVPDLAGFDDQASVEDFLEPYLDIDTQLIHLGPNDAIYLFELAATSTSAAAYDLQDLIVLLTVQNSPDGSFD